MLILMGVRNGARHLPVQLESLLASGVKRWSLWVSDDGSTDDSRAVIEDFAARLGGLPHEVRLFEGPGQGFAANYMSLLARLPDMPGPVALADQDDLWLAGRLGRQGAMLNRAPQHVPAFVCGRRIDWWPGRRMPSPSPLPPRPRRFANALVENIAFGNTIVVNHAAARLLRAAAPLAGTPYAHDWWIYQMLTGAGALSLMDTVPAVLYRQHAGNAIGAGRGLGAWLARKHGVMSGLYGHRLGQQFAALAPCEAFLAPENRVLLAQVMAACRGPRRLRRLRRTAVYRQSLSGQIGLWGAAGLGRV